MPQICRRDYIIYAGSSRKFIVHAKHCSFKNLKRSVSSLFHASAECAFSPLIFISQVTCFGYPLHIITFALNLRSEFELNVKDTLQSQPQP